MRKQSNKGSDIQMTTEMPTETVNTFLSNFNDKRKRWTSKCPVILKRIGLRQRRILCITLIACLSGFMSSLWGQCPTPCTNHSSSTSTTVLPLCGVGTVQLDGNIDNNSDCEDGNNDNCWEFIITRPNANVMGFIADIGKGMGCMGQINTFYTLIDNVCTTLASAGSQNQFNFEFGVSNEMRIYICDNSSGEVSICNLCADVLCPDPTATIEITKNN